MITRLLIKVNLLFFFLIVSFSYTTFCNAQESQEPWKENQLMNPAELSSTLSDPENKKPVIYNIGPAGQIKNAIFIGDGNEKDNIEKLKVELNKLSHDAHIVIYCGCCPFDACPNIRPVFQLLNEMGFTNSNLLNLPQNLKVDWIDKGYPVEE